MDNRIKKYLEPENRFCNQVPEFKESTWESCRQEIINGTMLFSTSEFRSAFNTSMLFDLHQDGTEDLIDANLALNIIQEPNEWKAFQKLRNVKLHAQLARLIIDGPGEFIGNPNHTTTFQPQDLPYPNIENIRDIGHFYSIEHGRTTVILVTLKHLPKLLVYYKGKIKKIFEDQVYSKLYQNPFQEPL